MAVQAAQQRGDDGAQAKARSQLAHVLFAAGQIEQAVAELSTCRSLIPADTMSWLLAETSHLEGVIAFRCSDLPTARKRFDEAASIQRSLGDRLGEATVAGSIARIDIATGQAARAVPLLEKGLQIFRDLGDSAGEIATGYHLGRAWESMGRPDDALSVYAECLRLAETGVLYRTGELLLRMAALHLRAERTATAADLAQRAVAFYRTRGEPLRQAEAHETLGRALIASGQEEQGRAELAQAAVFRARDGSDQMPA
jgi:tetratricopeptide (TPR) repeat protein